MPNPQTPTLDAVLLDDLAGVISERLPVSAISGGQWRDLGALSMTHKVFPLLYRLVLAQPDVVGTEILSWFNHAGLMHKARAVRFERAIAEVNDILQGAGLPACWLKGAALAYMLYPAFWLRSMIDIDVLVPFDVRQNALDALRAAGYRDSAKPWGRELGSELSEATTNHYIFRARDNKGVTVELHYRLLRLGQTDAHDTVTEWFWTQTRDLQTPHGSLHVLTPEAVLLHMAAHDVLQHEQAEIAYEPVSKAVTLRNIYDVHLLVTQHKLDWALLRQRASELAWDYAIARILTQAQHYFGTPVPDEMTEDLTAPAAQAAHISEQRKDNIVVIGWGVLRHVGWRDRARYVRNALFPTPGYMRAKYPGRPLGITYAARIAGIAFRAAGVIFRSIVRRFIRPNSVR